MPLTWAWLVPFTLFCMRVVSIGKEKMILGESPLIIGDKSSIISHLNPNLGAYILNVIIVSVLVVTIVRYINHIKTSHFKSTIVFIVFILFSYALWSLILLLFTHVVLGSDVPFLVDHLFELNYFSLLIIGSIGLLFFSYYFLLSKALDSQVLSSINRNTIALIAFLSGSVYIIIGIFIFEENIVSLLTPLIAILWLVFSSKSKGILGSNSFSILFFLFLCSFFVSAKLSSLNDLKFNEERASLAKYLATEKQKETEIQYASLSSKLEEDSFIKKLIKGHSNISLTDFEYMMESRYFKAYWESYEIKFNLFNSKGISFFTKDYIFSDVG